MNVEGQVALITGGASGLGAGAARILTRAGAKCALLDRNGALAEERGASLPFAGCLAAISALRQEAERSAKQIGPGE